MPVHYRVLSSLSSSVVLPSSKLAFTFTMDRAIWVELPTVDHYSDHFRVYSSPLQLPSFSKPTTATLVLGALRFASSKFFGVNQRRPSLAELLGLLKPTTTTFVLKAHYSHLRSWSPTVCEFKVLQRQPESNVLGKASVYTSKVSEWLTHCF